MSRDPVVQCVGATWTMIPATPEENGGTESELINAIREDPIAALRVAGLMMAEATGQPVRVKFDVLSGRAAKRAIDDYKAQEAGAAVSVPIALQRGATE